MNLEELQVLVALDATGSQAAAARRLGLSRATLRRRLEQLEARVGVPLVRVGQSGAELTEAAKVLATQARRVLSEAESLLETARAAAGRIGGRLRIAVPDGIPPEIHAEFFAWTREQHPDLEIDIRAHVDPLTLLGAEVDLVIHFGGAVPDGPWESFPIIEVPERAVATAEYLSRRGVPQRLEDLAKHDLVSWRSGDSDPFFWPLQKGGRLAVSPVFVSGNMLVNRAVIARGLGIGFVPELLMELPHEDGSPFVEVLPEQLSVRRAASVVVHESMLELPQIQLMLTMLGDVQRHPAVAPLFGHLDGELTIF